MIIPNEAGPNARSRVSKDTVLSLSSLRLTETAVDASSSDATDPIVSGDDCTKWKNVQGVKVRADTVYMR